MIVNNFMRPLFCPQNQGLCSKLAGESAILPSYVCYMSNIWLVYG